MMKVAQLSQVYTKSSPEESLTLKPAEYNRFTWDVVFGYFSLLAVALVFIALGEEFFLERGLGCNTNLTFNRDHHNYVVRWCSREVHPVHIFPFLVFIQIFAILAPHILWEIYAAPSLQQFFAMVPKLRPLRDKSTGVYDSETSRIVIHLVGKYREKTTLQISYKWKLTFQIIFSYFFVLLMMTLYKGGTEFQVDFICSQVGSINRPGHANKVLTDLRLDPFDVTCTHPTAKTYFHLFVIDTILLLISAVIGTVGRVWIKRNHWNELDHRGRADFCYSFGLNTDTEQYKPSNSHKNKCKIKDDLDLLTLLLFNSDRGHGEAFYNVLVELRLQERWANDFEDYANYVSIIVNCPVLKSTIKEELTDLTAVQTSGRQNGSELDPLPCLLGCHLIELCMTSGGLSRQEHQYDLYDDTLHLFCGSRGCSLSLARFSRKTTAVDFNPFYCLLESSSQPENPTEIVIEETFRDLLHFRVPNDLTSKTGPEAAQLTNRLINRKDPESNELLQGSYSLIVVSCMEQHFRASTAKVILETVLRQCDCPTSECFIVVCSGHRDLLDEVMNDFEGCFYETPLTSIVRQNCTCGIQTQLKPSQYVKCFEFNGQHIHIFFQVEKFNQKAYLASGQYKNNQNISETG